MEKSIGNGLCTVIHFRRKDTGQQVDGQSVQQTEELPLLDLLLQVKGGEMADIHFLFS